jgi:S1-C subfamily serine protease
VKRSARSLLLHAALGLAVAGCSAVELPAEPRPLSGMEEPVRWLTEPDDEAERQALDPGGFTGLYLGDARRTLEALTGDARGLAVESVVENSPAAAAGILEGDLVLSVRRVDAEGASQEVWLEWPSQWRALELSAGAGDELVLVLDRAGLELERTLVVAERLAQPEREAAPRLREDRRVGIVVRGATEVEARAAGLAPGAGAVVVGLAAQSPWRARGDAAETSKAGVVYGDVITAIGGKAVDHPEVVLAAIAAADPEERLEVAVQRQGAPLELSLPIARREDALSDVSIPLLYRYKVRGERRETSCLLGLVRWERTAVAWRVRLFWLIEFGGGDTDRLERVE